MSDQDDDELDGLCDEGLQPVPVDDENVDAVVLFADVVDSQVAVAERKKEYELLFRST